MRCLKSWLWIAVAVLLTSGLAAAQTTTGTISGRVVDSTDLPVPGVTVNVEGPNLQGILSVVTSENGDYIVPQLPPGTYTVTFQLSGFERQQKTVAIAPTQTLPVDAKMGPAAISETVNVVGNATSVLTKTAQVATDFKQDMIALLPTNRTIDAVVLRAPGVHPSGPSGAYSFSGAMSFESLFLVNGVTANENLRGQALNVYIEDAIQETIVATDGVSAEYGRFSGGLVNVITKSGGNFFSGSFRDSLFNDNWRTLVTGNDAHPFPPTGSTVASDSKIDKTVQQFEGVFGGPIAQNRLWFFSAGLLRNQVSSLNTIAPLNLRYDAENDRKRGEVKLTYSVTSSHRFEGAYTKEALDQINNTFQTTSSMDLASLYNRQQPTDLFTLNYNGILRSNVFVEGRFSSRHLSFIGSGAPFTDLIKGTLLLDRTLGGRYYSPTFCGVCDPEKRDNDNEYVKATYFKSTKDAGTHQIVFGYDTFNDKRFANNHQSGSDYRINGTRTIVRDGVIYPSWTPGTTTVLQFNPITIGSKGTNFRTHSLFANDNLRLNNHLTFNLGVRYDRNHGEDAAGQLVAQDSAISPRLGVIWDPKGDGKWSVTASVGKYVAVLQNAIADSSSPAGQPGTFVWTYTGPGINTDLTAPTSSLVDSATAIQRVFDWCKPSATGFCTTGGNPTTASLPGVSVKVPNSLNSPSVMAYAAGVSRQISNKAVVRADFSYRAYHDFYGDQIDLSTGTVTDQFGNKSDMDFVVNTDTLKRRYVGGTVSASYRVSARTDVGGNYTLSRLWGNFDGENNASGPLTSAILSYPEYHQDSWFVPEGDLASDQRHRSSMWLNYGVPAVNGLTISVLQDLASGTPYGAAGVVDTRPYVTNPGYAAAPGTVTYFYGARDAFRAEPSKRTDLALNYSHAITGGTRKVELFIQGQILNVFNNADMCACGSDVFGNGGAITATRISTSVLSSNSTATGKVAFNPFTTVPVQGATGNWDYNSTFGTPVNRFAFTSPRTFRMTFGVRF